MVNRIQRPFARYVPIETIHQGNKSETYKAKSEYGIREVALTIYGELVHDDQIAVFIQEVDTIAEIAKGNKNMPVLHKWGVQDNEPYIAMEYANAGSLQTLLDNNTVMSFPAAIFYMKTVADTLAYTYSKGVPHRHLTPSHILFTIDQPSSQPRLLVSGFYGAGEMLRRVSSPSPSIYSPSKDMSGSKEQDDIFSLGVVLLVLLLAVNSSKSSSKKRGKRKAGNFSRKNVEQYRKYIEQPHKHIPSLLKNMPTEVHDVLYKALAENPQERFTSFSDFSEALQVIPLRTLSNPQGNIFEMPFPKRNFIKVMGGFSAGILLGASGASTLERGQAASGKRIPIAGPSTLTNGKPAASPTRVVATPVATNLVATHSHEHKVTAVIATPDGRIISGDSHGDIHISVIDNSIYQGYYRHDDAIVAMALSPDGAYIASLDISGRVCIWKISSKETSLDTSIEGKNPRAIAWAMQDNDLNLLVAIDDTVFTFDNPIANKGFGFPDVQYKHDSIVNSLISLPNANVTVSCADDGSCQIWDIENRTQLFKYTSYTQEIKAIARPFNGRFVALGGVDGTIQIWHTPSLEELSEKAEKFFNQPDITIQPHSHRITALAWHPNKLYLACTADDNSVYILRFTGETIAKYTHNAPITSLTWLPQYDYIVFGSEDKSVHVRSITGLD